MEQNYIPIILPCQSTRTVSNNTLLVFQRFYVKLYIISLSSMQLRKLKKKKSISFSLYKFTKIRCITSREKKKIESHSFHSSPHRPITNDYANFILTAFQNNCCTMLDFQIQQHKTSDCDNAYMSKHEIQAPI